MADNKVYAIVRLRGKADTHYSVTKTLSLLRLHKVNHAVVYHQDSTIDGMVKKAKDKITWGEISKQDLIHLLTKRGEVYGKDNRLTDDYVKSNTKFKSIDEFVDAFFAGKTKITEIPGIQPVFRLAPPRKGFKSLKNPWGRRGDLGYRGDEMSKLIVRMA